MACDLCPRTWYSCLVISLSVTCGLAPSAIPPQTYIGPVLVSVNPYKELGIYGENHVKEYKGEAYYELPPHM